MEISRCWARKNNVDKDSEQQRKLEDKLQRPEGCFLEQNTTDYKAFNRTQFYSQSTEKRKEEKGGGQQQQQTNNNNPPPPQKKKKPNAQKTNQKQTKQQKKTDIN